MRAYRLGREARRDLHEIWDYIAADSADAADRSIARLLECFDLIARNPGVGHLRTDLTLKPLRFWAVDKYVVMYRLQRSIVEIVGAQGGRVTPAFLRRRG